MSKQSIFEYVLAAKTVKAIKRYVVCRKGEGKSEGTALTPQELVYYDLVIHVGCAIFYN